MQCEAAKSDAFAPRRVLSGQRKAVDPHAPRAGVALWHKRITIDTDIKPSRVGKLSQIDGSTPALFNLQHVIRHNAVIDQESDPCIARVFGVDNDFKFFRRDARIVGEMKLRVPVCPRPCLFDGNPTRL